MLLCIFFIGCKGDVVIPPHLKGVWKNTAPQYEDRYLKFTEHSLAYGTGGGKEESYQIERMEAEKTSAGTLYTFHYKDSERQEWAFTFIYSPDTGTIKIKNSDNIWKKISSAVLPDK